MDLSIVSGKPGPGETNYRLNAFEKRIRRRVVGRPTTFFAATSPGLEPLCLQELHALSLPGPLNGAIPGGVVFEGRLHHGFLANLRLRTANRVLMRINAFTASNFSALEKKMAAIPWELYLHADQPLGFRVTARRSRLYHTAAIAERCQKAIAARCALAGAALLPPACASPRQRLYIRALDDRFTISLDSSGEALYRRGPKKQVTAAPLRETIAAAILILAQYRPPETLVDPMCGAGSFSLEAAMQARNIPAGWFQDFAFFNWPAFTLTRRRWLHILSRHRQRIVDAARATIFASDIDPAACEALKKNAATSGLAATISVSQRDFFGLSPRECGPAPGLVTLNPPFGRRIGSVGQSRRLFGEIFEELNARWRGWRVGIVVPHQSLLKAVPFAAASLPVRCGGLRLFLVTGKIPP